MTKKLDEMIDELRGAPLSEVDKFAIRTILESLLETIKETPKTENSNAGAIDRNFRDDHPPDRYRMECGLR